MKRRDLIKRLTDAGYEAVRDTGPHTIYSNGVHAEPIPKHKEINEKTATEILKRTGA
ncbi:MAG: type II toxin-antitoxin system HicA family toxin [Oscillospiraceae bacterium]|jgi:mRNA interferase HicA|nr:type II toxin-antitoxin system HicA family toxin [Oscillospiraceae bacterium]